MNKKNIIYYKYDDRDWVNGIDCALLPKLVYHSGYIDDNYTQLIIKREKEILKVLFPDNHSKLLLERNYGIILEENLFDRIMRLNKAFQGFPIDVTDKFIRALYLSAVTITTLGFGDIVPITSLSRIIIIIETISGIIIIGLFLNSLRHGNDRQK
jgi:hypothetical protein